jgi:hypothetical protein
MRGGQAWQARKQAAKGRPREGRRRGGPSTGAPSRTRARGHVRAGGKAGPGRSHCQPSCRGPSCPALPCTRCPPLSLSPSPPPLSLAHSLTRSLVLFSVSPLSPSPSLPPSPSLSSRSRHRRAPGVGQRAARRQGLTEALAHFPPQLVLKVLNLLQHQRARRSSLEIVALDFRCAQVALVGDIRRPD